MDGHTSRGAEESFRVPASFAQWRAVRDLLKSVDGLAQGLMRLERLSGENDDSEAEIHP